MMARHHEGHRMKRHARLAREVIASILPALVASAALAQAPAPGSVPAADAVAALEAHVASIEARQAAMEAKYDYAKAPATLVAAFREKGVDPSVEQVAQSWGKNAVYLAWTNVTRSFYTRHRDALVATIGAIRASRAAAVPHGELAYFDQGMRAWLEYEKSAPASFAEGDKILASRALFIGQANQFAAAGQSQAAETARAQADRHSKAYDDFVDIALGEFKRKTFFEARAQGSSAAPCMETKVENPKVVAFEAFEPLPGRGEAP
jgi:hypothetical protein